MKTRIIWTKIWEDDWFQSLSDNAQKLFLYLLTNSRINMCGCYQISERVLLFDTRIKNLDKVKSELIPKVRFYEDWVYVVNAESYSGYRGSKNERALEKEKNSIPLNIKNALFYEKEYRVSDNNDSVSSKSDTTINHKSEIINNKYNNIEDLKEEDFENISEKYQVPVSFVKSKLDDLINWHEKNPQKNHYKNYLSALRDWVKRDSLKIKLDYGKQNSEVSI